MVLLRVATPPKRLRVHSVILLAIVVSDVVAVIAALSLIQCRY